jgi:hypothetical protein
MSDEQMPPGWSESQQIATLLLEAQQAIAEARQLTDEPGVLVCLLRVEQALLRIGLLRQSMDSEQQ